MNCKSVAKQVVAWLKKQPLKGFVVGVSGGIDSAVVSTLCAMTGKITNTVSIPIRQDSSRAMNHMRWLVDKFKNVRRCEFNMSAAFDTFERSIGMSELARANAMSRMRMMTLYAVANSENMLVVGTGNKIEDYGVGFFTKYGDGGIDISPIGELTKTEVRELARYLGINQEVIDAAPSDGLWVDGRTDEDQIGATYEELEWAMRVYPRLPGKATARQKQVFKIYKQRHEDGSHKMCMPPVCKVRKS